VILDCPVVGVAGVCGLICGISAGSRVRFDCSVIGTEEFVNVVAKSEGVVPEVTGS